MDIRMGRYNEIPDGTFVAWKDGEAGPVVVGDCNRIHDGVRILVGPGGFKIGDYNVVHNRCTLGGPGPFRMGHNCWLGQECFLDSTGGLALGNGVRVGMRACVWSHIGSGEQVEGWVCKETPTTLHDYVWLVGDNVHVAAGVTMYPEACALAHSVVTRSVQACEVVAGNPARVTTVNLQKNVSRDERWAMMLVWVEEFCKTYSGAADILMTTDRRNRTVLVFSEGVGLDLSDTPRELAEKENVTYFDLTTKTYTKRLTDIERQFIRFLLPNRARFIPKGEDA